MPVARVDRPEHDPLAEPVGRSDDRRGEAAAGRAEQFRLGAGAAQALRAERDLVGAQPGRQPVEGRHLRVVVAVVSDGHPGPQLPPDEVGILVGEIADREESGVDV